MSFRRVAALTLILFPLAGSATPRTCLVVGIADDDTLTAHCGPPGTFEQVKVRLAEIDAPEKKQPFGVSAYYPAVEFATLEWVCWFNHQRLLEPIGYIPAAEAEANYYRELASQSVKTAA